MLRDILADRLAQMKAAGVVPDYPLLARDVLGIRGASADLARRLVEQALVLEDRRESWQRVGERACRDAPDAPGVYIFRDADGRALYIGKAANLRRRLRAQFANRRWRALLPAMARVERVEFQTAGSELEALLREATLIRELRPSANIQIGDPALDTRALPPALVRDVVIVVPSIDGECVELVAAKADGGVACVRTARSGANLGEAAARLWRFLQSRQDEELYAVESRNVTPSSSRSLAPLVFSWIAGRGRNVTRVNPADVATGTELRGRLASLLGDSSLFVERLVAIR